MAKKGRMSILRELDDPDHTEDEIVLAAMRDGRAVGEARGVRTRGESETGDDGMSESSGCSSLGVNGTFTHWATEGLPTRTSKVPKAYSWEPQDTELPVNSRLPPNEHGPHPAAAYMLY